MNSETFISIFDLIIFPGIIQGILLSWYFIRSSRKEVLSNRWQGLLLLCLSMVMLEELLNNTGYIVKVLKISNFAESFNFTFGPLVFLYIRCLLYPENRKPVWPHFVIFAFWSLYMIPFFLLPDEIKYNSYVWMKHPDWPLLDVSVGTDGDPFRIRHYVNLFTGVHFTGYFIAVVSLLGKKMKEKNEQLFRLSSSVLRLARNITLHFLIIFIIFAFVKFYFGADLGDYLISAYISVMIFSTTCMVLKNSTYFTQPKSFLQFPGSKYEKSSLSGRQKAEIHKNILKLMEEESYFTRNLASLSDLSRRINESSHHVSQVINEIMGKSFFELLATYRVEEAKKIIEKDKDSQFTVEEIAERVGYNSRSSFNTVFKKYTGQTPTEFRRSCCSSR